MAWAGDSGSYQDFISRHGLTFVNLDDSEGDVFQRFNVPGQPAWAFVSQDGTAEVELGGLSASELDDRVMNLTS